ncbi:MAG: hypothetical protein HY554_07570 [Elusimicrobia bacterium]|nr:hypothetical protein [Elusimicrobiota bacterium]
MPKYKEDAAGGATAGRLARAMLLSPGRAAETLSTDRDAIGAALVLYLVYLAVSVAFYSWKPVEFPAPGGAPGLLGGEPLPQSPVFWAKVQAWNPLLTAIWLVFLAWFASFLQGGRLALRLLGGASLGVMPIVPILLYTGNQAPRWSVLASWVVVFGVMAPGLRRRRGDSWRRLAGLVLSIVIVNVALSPAFALAVLAGSEAAYQGLEIVMLFWTLGLGAYLLGRMESIATARAFAALFFSMLCQLLLVASLHLAGIVPKDILKALMSV